MNSWKQYPNLFANGKFRVLCEDHIYEIVGHSFNLNGHFYGFKLFDGAHKFYKPISDCTLIARKIESMSDEEIRRLCHNNSWQYPECERMRKHLIAVVNNNSVPLNTALGLAEIGVYPFDQKDFDTGEVIDSKTALSNDSIEKTPTK